MFSWINNFFLQPYTFLFDWRSLKHGRNTNFAVIACHTACHSVPQPIADGSKPVKLQYDPLTSYDLGTIREVLTKVANWGRDSLGRSLLSGLCFHQCSSQLREAVQVCCRGTSVTTIWGINPSDVAILVRVGLVETRAFFWMSWIDLHGIYTTLMFLFHILRPFRTNFLCFPWWKNDYEVWRGFLFLFIILCWVTFVYKPACPNARITWERKERSIKSMLKVIWER